MIGILDYGMANLRSVQNAFARVGHPAEVISSPDQVRTCDHLVLPGVGAFKDAMAALRQSGADQAVKDHIKAGKPFLGICLGLQMLFDVGYEDGEHRGLGVLGGQCVRFNVDDPGVGLKVPHMGWNQLAIQRPSPLTRGLADLSNVYFVHGYHVVPTDENVIATTTDYGRSFVSSVWRDNVMATQFHPEKSQAIGLTMLKNFAMM
ncbi:MAG TPA: imidazole glycerol phosphate synthase subunit HisH [Tepidisphaeraceae bacterium]